MQAKSAQINTIGRRMREFCSRKYSSVNDFAKELGMDATNVQSYMRGARKPGEKVLQRLEAVGCNTSWLLTGDGEMEKGVMPEIHLQNGRQTPVKQAVEEERVLYSAANGPTLIYVAMGKAMTPEGSNIKDGDRLIIDIEAKPKVGDYVLAKVGDGPGIVAWTPDMKQWTGVVIKLTRDYR